MKQITEENLDHSTEKNHAAIEQALALIDKLAALKHVLGIKDGAGHRYIHHSKPSQKQLKEAEKIIQKQYANKQPPKKNKTTSLVQTLNRKGMA